VKKATEVFTHVHGASQMRLNFAEIGGKLYISLPNKGT